HLVTLSWFRTPRPRLLGGRCHPRQRVDQSCSSPAHIALCSPEALWNGCTRWVRVGAFVFNQRRFRRLEGPFVTVPARRLSAASTRPGRGIAVQLGREGEPGPCPSPFYTRSD